MKNILVFISSTFSDLEGTRSRLVNSVFKGLEEYAADRGVRLGVIDLVWGIPDVEPGAEAEIIRRCLDLVDEASPYFLSLIGNRYGWAPGPETLDALAPHMERPEDGTSVTALEILRYFDRCSEQHEETKGLFVLKASGQDDSTRLEGLRSTIRVHPRAEVYITESLSPDNEPLFEAIQNYFKLTIDRAAAAPLGEWRFPTQMVGRLHPREHQIREGLVGLSDLGPSVEGKRKIVLVKGTDDLARLSYIDFLCREWQDQDSNGVFEQVHVGAEAIFSYERLRALLDQIETVQTKDAPNPRLIALDGLEDMPMWHAPEDAPLKGKYGLIGHIWASESRGVNWVIGANFQARPGLLAVLESEGLLSECTVINIDPDMAEAGQHVRRYLRNFGKELSDAQARMIVESLEDKAISPTEFLLICDRIRRISSVNREKGRKSQEEFMQEKIRGVLPDSRSSLYSGLLREIRDHFGGRQSVALHALSLICASSYGVSLEDVQKSQFGSIEEPMTVVEWTLLRAILGPLLVGTTHRIRIPENQSRQFVSAELGWEAVRCAQTRLAKWLFEKSSNRSSLSQLDKVDTALVNDLPELIEVLGWDSPDAARFFDPSLFLSWALHDPSLLSYQFYRLIEDKLPPGPVVDGDFLDSPWSGIDRLDSIIAGTDIAEMGGARSFETMDDALADMDMYCGSMEHRVDSLGGRASACIYAGMRGRVHFRARFGQDVVDEDLLHRALSSACFWAVKLSRLHGVSSADRDRAWHEVAAWLLLSLTPGDANGRIAIDERLQMLEQALGQISRDLSIPAELRNAIDATVEIEMPSRGAKMTFRKLMLPTSQRLAAWLERVTGWRVGSEQAMSILRIGSGDRVS
jgi:hypothetical protein